MNKHLKAAMIYGTIAVGCFSYPIILDQTSDYMVTKRVDVTVLDKFASQGRSSSNFILSLKTREGVVFDEYVSFSTFSGARPGDTLTFNLRRFDIRQTQWENTYNFFGRCAALAVGIVSLVSSFIAIGLYRSSRQD